ncbi:hypothetical protein F751_1744 [Auxenochlorella protothecoides]|uniref:Uncharacterized protein n=1 Tax=Auxenochlorella protothecoides TaxID=3075 RepID=A0A087SGL1_AUXPR|nr:hypothetical protein F751_1744 [Auxenochlorella protothecoides]KFM24865.1 hypothetical protein F751_1744 [Auxenochlorella protothecoides]
MHPLPPSTREYKPASMFDRGQGSRASGRFAYNHFPCFFELRLKGWGALRWE